MPRALTETRLPVAFAGLEPPPRWPRPHSAPRPELLQAGVETLPRVGPAVRGRLAKLGLRTVGDLLAHRPRRYERPIDERSIRDLFGEEEAVIEGVVLGTTSRRGRGRLHILTARVADGTGEIKATWFNQPWLEAQLVAGTRVRLRGRPNRYGFHVESYDLGEATETADYAPVYPASEALAQKQLRALVGAALERVRAEGDPLPATLAAVGEPAASSRRPRRAPSPPIAGGGGNRSPTPRLRRASRACSSHSPAAPPSESGSSRRHCLRRESFCGATGRCSRSRSRTIRSVRSPRSTATSP